MAKILITSGPTRQYLDPVRYLSNASSGRMGSALASAAIELGHSVTVVTGPVSVMYPHAAEVVPVVSTDELLEVCRGIFPQCDGVIGAAAPCDYRPVKTETSKISKTGEPLALQLVETPDVIATLGTEKRPGQWVVGFALETDDQRFRAITKLERKSCDLIVLNGPSAMDSLTNSVEIIDRSGNTVGNFQGPKLDLAREILAVIQRLLIDVG